MIGLAKGMATTLRYILRPARTVQYPLVKRELPERSRTMFVLPLDENGVPQCKACMLCAKNCPDKAIEIESEKREDGPGRRVTKFSIDLGKCMYCGICVENCTSDGIRHTGDYERATHDRDATVVTLFEATFGFEPADEPAAAEEAAAPAEQQQPSTDAEGGEGV